MTLILTHADGTILYGERGDFHGAETIRTERGERYTHVYVNEGFVIEEVN